eukprot:6201975-Pleurochrysis_carterae.AAC.1
MVSGQQKKRAKRWLYNFRASLTFESCCQRPGIGWAEGRAENLLPHSLHLLEAHGWVLVEPFLAVSREFLEVERNFPRMVLLVLVAAVKSTDSVSAVPSCWTSWTSVASAP